MRPLRGWGEVISKETAMQEFEFVENRSGLWFVGILVLFVGVLGAILISPGIDRSPDLARADAHSKMETRPPQDAPKMPLQAKP
jgi:hypothetical protein